MPKVLLVGYPLACVGPDATGGAEQVLSMLDRGLTARGVETFVVAPEGSTVAGRLIATRPVERPLDDVAVARARVEHRDAVSRAIRTFGIDVVHAHGVDFGSYVPEGDRRTIATLHLPPAWYSAETFFRADVHLVCVSEAQRRACPAGVDPVVIPNGVELDRFWFRNKKRGFALMLGRICPEKGFEHALEAAKRAGVPLLIGGRVYGYASHERYFAEELAPRLDGRVRFLGAVSGGEKRRLLANARCVLIPSLAAETSSLVAMEAAASGTPVIAYASGALPEVVEHGSTGFIAGGVAEMAEAIARADELLPEVCRERAEAQFSSERMVDAYASFYQRVLGTRSIGRAKQPPRLSVEVLATREELEALAPEWTALADRCEDAMVFQRPEWLSAWMRVFEPEAPQVVIARAGSELAGVGAFLIYRTGRTRVLGLLGGMVSDAGDLLLDPAHAAQCGPAIVEYLAARSDAWDLCDFRGLPPCSPLILHASGGDLVKRVKLEAMAPVIELPRAIEDLPLTARFARRLRRAARIASELGGARYRLATDAAEASADLERLFALHGARWHTRGEAGVLADPRVLRFHREVIGPLSLSGLARIYTLSIGDREAAALYALVEKNRTLLYLSGFAPELEHASPGSLIILHAIEEAIRAGQREVDLLRGSESYKYEWGAKDRPLLRVKRVRVSSASRPAPRADPAVARTG